MAKVPLDIYEDMPHAMKRYISHFGWRFNKAACKDAVSMMWKKDKDGKKQHIEFKDKEEINELLKKHGIEIEYKILYDYVYVYHMIIADLLGNTPIKDELGVLQTVKAMIDDPDNPGGNFFRHWYWDMKDKGKGVDFEDYLDE